ncbi:MAG: class 3 fructose-bisphosphatase [Eubacteriales Family XIII. Incertae Sedis bacterium]|nr:MAG: class 3 fructose-bisphosphatase [Clostridiales Family XIII bacterium]
MDNNLRYLQLLAKDYPNTMAVFKEIINLKAILALPKGTEYFISDLHGEHEAFIHMVRSASGVIHAKIEELYGRVLCEEERDSLAALIYNPQAEIARRKKSEEDMSVYYRNVIFRLIEVCRSVSTKYTRSKVRKRLPQYYDYIMDELLHADDEANRAYYYSEIINSVISLGIADTFISELADSISRLAVDHLHIIGDIFDRGAHPDDIMDFLIEFHDVDFQWGNHDVVWMGAAAGNIACIANVLRMNISYNNFDMLEIGYGINLRPLTTFAERFYGNDPCEYFKPKVFDENKYDPVGALTAARMNKAIAICQFKAEGQMIMAHPEYNMEERLLLDKIDYENGTIAIDGKTYELRDKNFPTIDPQNPYEFTEDEKDLLRRLRASFEQSEKLQKHIRFLFSHGALYKAYNNNLMYHGCVPMTENGEFEEVTIFGKTIKGKELFDYLDEQVRAAYFTPENADGKEDATNLMWYLWLGSKSPLFGKDKMTTLERCFVADESTHKERTVPYYSLIEDKAICEKILAEFGLDPESAHILSGHVPVKVKDGKSPIKGKGKLFIIDGGMSKAYQKDTGIAGYTFIYNSRFMALSEHKPYSPLKSDGTQEFHTSTMRTVELFKKRIMVRDTDQGDVIQGQVDDLMQLAEAYRKGEIKEVY